MDARRPWLLFIVGMALTVMAAVWMKAVDPGRIIPFEFSATREGAWGHVEVWKKAGTLADARSHTLRDYAFLSAYWIPIAAVCIGLSRRMGRWAARGLFFAVVAGAASVFDAIENFFLLQIISAGEEATNLASFSQELPAFAPALATTAASIKFVLLLAAVAYALIAAGRTLLGRGAHEVS